ncbi:sensor histidine kinase, partial [Natronomonas sp.]|uniref:sensor histidine kinase n=1 Tax=Natronomonas sp. TaxID=2184060 RepID=UPI002FC2A744
LQPIVQALDRMEGLISDTLTLAREGQVVADFEPIQLTNLIGSCWKTAATEEATVEIEDEITIKGDRSRLCHVFENLFRNAIEHGGADVTVRVGRIDEYGIYVEDDGPGIPEDERERVFEPGHTSVDGGTGFGLAIVRRITEAHGWEVEIVEGSDGGTRFEFTGVDLVR